MRLIPIFLRSRYCADDNTAHSDNINLNKALHNLEKESNTFTLQARNNKSKLTLMEWPSPTVNVKLGIHIDLLSISIVGAEI